MRLRDTVSVAAAAALGLALGACAPSGTATSNPGEPLSLGTPGDRIDTVLGVAYYPACRNEELTYDGQRWYPFTPANADEFPTLDSPVTSAAPAAGGPASVSVSRGRPVVGLAPLVVAPGPGDDVGTLTFYEGGFAYWVSASGDIWTWLTTKELTYNWVC